ncbi:hypothetical protein PPYR_07529 [Photinus pyralis]|uniref:28S ribosomal protein S27, mitochondrial n=1 Tax=Photinus pyralis TaxID=7054 RepID=A0A1Y1NAY2_PHOPY|nr:uncharacterized protein LOC116168634 [Photinus pyralis]KAB0799649.1 hypothetical protein PPYR_07529 [Photinus pyralis]
MFKVFKQTLKVQVVNVLKVRTFLSHAYYCNEVWDQRFQDSILEKVNLDELYNELEQQYQRTRNINAVDVDVFAHSVRDESYIEELLDLLYKLRMSADTCNTLNSTSHAVIRDFTNFAKTDQLLQTLDDRLNYGVFLDHYTANLLLDTFWKSKDYRSGARVASQLMLQEDFNHPISSSLSLLHCFKFLQNPSEWPQPPKPEEPEEEVRVRVKYVRNPHDDEHFDLKDPHRIVGKTLIEIARPFQDSLNRSFYLLGVMLYKPDKAVGVIDKFVKDNVVVYKNVLSVVPEEALGTFSVDKLQMESVELGILEDNVRTAVNKMSEKDIAVQCEAYVRWEKERKEALENQHKRLLAMQRLSNIEKLQKDMKEKEMLLWFFENEEKIELEIEAKKKEIEASKMLRRGPKMKEDEEEYIPPEVYKRKSV